MNVARWIARIADSRFGPILKKAFVRYREGSVVRIRHGHAAGFRWKRLHRYSNGYWVGHYRPSEQEVIVRELAPGRVFFDVGANAGFFGLVAARRVGAGGKVVAFDPLPENAAHMRESFKMNGLAQCHVVEAAVCAGEGRGAFYFPRPGAGASHLGAVAPWGVVPGEQVIWVRLTSLDKAVEAYGAPDFVKMDIEGGEVGALEGAARLLSERRPVWLIELHGDECAAGVRRILAEHSYAFSALEGRAVSKDEALPRHVVAKPC